MPLLSAIFDIVFSMFYFILSLTDPSSELLTGSCVRAEYHVKNRCAISPFGRTFFQRSLSALASAALTLGPVVLRDTTGKTCFLSQKSDLNEDVKV